MDEISVPTEIIFYHGTFVHSITPEGPLQPQSQTRESASLRKLSGFSEKHLIELSSDMYDELQRRVQANGRKTGPLSPRNDIHWKRNDARRHVGSLPEHRFREICRDLVTEQERRYPELKTGPTYPLQDAMPMAVRPTTSSWISRGSLGSNHHFSNPSNPSFVSEASHSSKENTGNTSKKNDSKLQIQSVSESNITPIKAHIVESDSDSDDERRKSKRKSQMRKSSVIASQVRTSTGMSPKSSRSPKSLRSLPPWEATVDTNTLNGLYNGGESNDSEVTLDSDIEESVPLAEYIHHANEDAEKAVQDTEPVPDSPITSLYSTKKSSDSSQDKNGKTKSPTQLLSPLSGSAKSAEPNTSQLEQQDDSLSQSGSIKSSGVDSVVSQNSDQTSAVNPQLPNISRTVEPNVELEATENLKQWPEPEHNIPSPTVIEQAAEIERLQQEVLELRQTLRTQEEITAKVRQEAVQFLREMRELTEQHEQQVSRAEHADLEVTQWKRRHNKLLKEFEQISKQRIDHCISLPAVPQPFPAQYRSVDGVVNQGDLNRFLSSVSALVSVIRQKHHSQDVLDILHEIITSSRKITTKNTLVSRCANQLISVVRNYTVSTGLFPKIVVDSACSDIIAAVIDFVKSNKLRVNENRTSASEPSERNSEHISLRPSSSKETQPSHASNSPRSQAPAGPKKVPYISILNSNKAAIMNKGNHTQGSNFNSQSLRSNTQVSNPKSNVFSKEDKNAEVNHQHREASVGSISKDQHLILDSFETSIGIANRVTVKSPSIGSVEFFSRESSPAVPIANAQDGSNKKDKSSIEQSVDLSVGQYNTATQSFTTVSSADNGNLTSGNTGDQYTKENETVSYSRAQKILSLSNGVIPSITIAPANQESGRSSSTKAHSLTRKVAFESKTAISDPIDTSLPNINNLVENTASHDCHPLPKNTNDSTAKEKASVAMARDANEFPTAQIDNCEFTSESNFVPKIKMSTTSLSDSADASGSVAKPKPETPNDKSVLENSEFKNREFPGSKITVPSRLEPKTEPKPIFDSDLQIKDLTKGKTDIESKVPEQVRNHQMTDHKQDNKQMSSGVTQYDMKQIPKEPSEKLREYTKQDYKHEPVQEPKQKPEREHEYEHEFRQQPKQEQDQESKQERKQELGQQSKQELEQQSKQQPKQAPENEFKEQSKQEPEQQFKQQPKQEPRWEHKQEPKREHKQEFKQQPKQEPKHGFKQEPKQELEQQFKQEPKQQPKQQPKQEPEHGFKQQPEQEFKQELEQQPEQEPKQKFEQQFKQEPKQQPKQEPEQQFKQEPKQEPKQEFKQGPKQQPKQEFKQQAEHGFKHEPKQEFKQQPKHGFKQEPKQEPEQQFKQEPKQEPKQEFKQEPKQQPKQEFKQQPEHGFKQEPKQEFKQEPKHGFKQQPEHGFKQEPEHELKQKLEQEPEKEFKQELKHEFKHEFKEEFKQEPKQQPKQEPEQEPEKEPNQQLNQQPRQEPEQEPEQVFKQVLKQDSKQMPERMFEQQLKQEPKQKYGHLSEQKNDLGLNEVSTVQSDNANMPRQNFNKEASHSKPVASDPSASSFAPEQKRVLRETELNINDSAPDSTVLLRQSKSAEAGHEISPQNPNSKSFNTFESTDSGKSIPKKNDHANIPRDDSAKSDGPEQNAWKASATGTLQRDLTPDSGAFPHIEPHSGLPYGYSPRFRPLQGPHMPRDESALALHNYLEEQTSHAVEAIGALLSAIKTNAVAGELKPLIVSIQTLVGEMIDTTAKSLGDTRSAILKEKGSFIVQNMRDCLTRMDMIRLDELEAIRDDARPNRHLKQRLAGVNFDMAKCTKELIKSVEEVVLEDEMADLGSRMH